jgi:hypothetical protein
LFLLFKKQKKKKKKKKNIKGRDVNPFMNDQRALTR